MALEERGGKETATHTARGPDLGHTLHRIELVCCIKQLRVAKWDAQKVLGQLRVCVCLSPIYWRGMSREPKDTKRSEEHTALALLNTEQEAEAGVDLAETGHPGRGQGAAASPGTGETIPHQAT